MIAMALINTPIILIADEPTTGLDLTIQAQIMELLIRIRKEKNLSILFISHDLALVSSFCDRIYVLNHGKVVESGETAQIIHAPQQPYTKKLIWGIMLILVLGLNHIIAIQSKKSTLKKSMKALAGAAK